MKIFYIEKRANQKFSVNDLVIVRENGVDYISEIVHVEEDDGETYYYVDFVQKLDGSEDVPKYSEEAYTENQMIMYKKGVSWEAKAENYKNNQYGFNLDKYEVFIYHGIEYDVRRAKILLAENPRNTINFPVDSVSYYIRSGAINTAITPENASSQENIDLGFPIIGVYTNDSEIPWPIDGWHRLAKAHYLNIETLPMLVLSKEETKLIISK